MIAKLTNESTGELNKLNSNVVNNRFKNAKKNLVYKKATSKVKDDFLKEQKKLAVTDAEKAELVTKLAINEMKLNKWEKTSDNYEEYKEIYENVWLEKKMFVDMYYNTEDIKGMVKDIKLKTDKILLNQGLIIDKLGKVIENQEFIIDQNNYIIDQNNHIIGQIDNLAELITSNNCFVKRLPLGGKQYIGNGCPNRHRKKNNNNNDNNKNNERTSNDKSDVNKPLIIGGVILLFIIITIVIVISSKKSK